MKILVAVKGGSGSGNWGHAGRPGLVGGSGGGIKHWEEYGDAPVVNLGGQNKVRLRAFETMPGPLELYHVTMVDRVDSILQDGLIPGRLAAPGQTWKAEHSDYAIYFHSSKHAAEYNVQQANDIAGERVAVIIKALYPRTVETAQRILPDEDVNSNPNDGLRTLNAGDAVAIIGGAYPEQLEIVD